MTADMLDVMTGQFVVDVKRARDMNNRLMLTERAFLFPEGLPGKPWMKHVLHDRDIHMYIYIYMHTCVYEPKAMVSHHHWLRPWVTKAPGVRFTRGTNSRCSSCRILSPLLETIRIIPLDTTEYPFVE